MSCVRLLAVHGGIGARHRASSCQQKAQERLYRTMRLITRLVIPCLLLIGARAEGQQATASGSWRPVANPVAGWHALGPVLLSVTAVAGYGTGDLNTPEPNSKFILAAIEPGIHAGRASLAMAYWRRWEGGLVLRATALRFWEGTPRRSYFGGEAQWVISVLPLGVRIGAFRPTGDSATPKKTLWLADLSVMY